MYTRLNGAYERGIPAKGYGNEMSYDYTEERPKLFTESGQVMFIKFRDVAHELLKEAGAFRASELFAKARTGGDTFQMLACIDRLVELGEIVELKRDGWGQYRVFTTPQVHNR